MRNKTRQLALLAIIAGVYAVTTVALGGISYGPLNLRFTNIILGVVPILGMPSVFGLALGVFFANIASPLGPIDLVSSLFALVGLGAIYYLRNRSVILGLAIYTIIIGLWVTFELSFVLGIPYLPSLYYVTAGNAIVNALAYGFYKTLNGTGIRMRLAHVQQGAIPRVLSSNSESEN